MAGGACMARGVHGRGHAWPVGCAWGGHAWGDVCGGMHGWGHAWRGAFVTGGVCVAGGHAWQKGDVHGNRGHAWRRVGACVAKLEACMVCMHPLLRDTAGQCAGGTHPTGMHSCGVFLKNSGAVNQFFGAIT